jgi:hypothetical protein
LSGCERKESSKGWSLGVNRPEPITKDGVKGKYVFALFCRDALSSFPTLEEMINSLRSLVCRKPPNRRSHKPSPDRGEVS